MTDSDVRSETWKPIPGARWYMASDRGEIRSLTHTTRGRLFEGRVLRPRLDGDGYLVVNVTYDSEGRKHGVSVARLVLLAHAGEPEYPELQACHGEGGKRDNRWPENLRWDTDEANRADRARDHPPKPKPPKVCPRCRHEHNDPGRRCHPCVTELACLTARRLAAGEDDLEALARDLGYPSAVGLFKLAKRYGGLECAVEPLVLIDEANAAVREASRTGHSRWWLRLVTESRKRDRGDRR